MKKCPGPLTWQAVIDGEEESAQHMEHLESCPACRAVYHEIKDAAELAGSLYGEALPAPDFAAAVMARVSLAPAAPFPAGLVAALLFAAAAAAALLLDPGYWNWWLSVGLTRNCSLLLDALFSMISLGRGLNPACLLGPAALLVLLETFLLRKLKTVGGYWDEKI